MGGAASLHVALGPGLTFQFENLPGELISKVPSYLWYFIDMSSPRTGPPIILDGLPPADNIVTTAASVCVDEPPLSVRSMGTTTLFELPEILGWCDPQSGRGGLTFGAPSSGDFDNFTHLALVPMLTELAIGREWLGLHAAALAFEGRGILLPGPSGAGKSTISVAASKLGCELLSDDVVWLRKGKDGFRIRPFPRGGDRDWMPKPGVEEIDLAAIVCPEIAGKLDLCRLTPAPLMQILPVLLNQGGFLSEGVSYAERFRAIVELASSAPGYRLEAGRDRMAGPRALVRLAAELG